jgi:CDP-diglyceride synthetase
VVAAIIVLVLGFLLGNLLSAVVRTAASNAGLKNADGLGKISLYAIVFFSAAIALIQLGIGEEVVVSAFELAFGAAALALALAFGLGGRDVAAEYLKRWLGEKKAPARKSPQARE